MPLPRRGWWGPPFARRTNLTASPNNHFNKYWTNILFYFAHFLTRSVYKYFGIKLVFYYKAMLYEFISRTLRLNNCYLREWVYLSIFADINIFLFIEYILYKSFDVLFWMNTCGFQLLRRRGKLRYIEFIILPDYARKRIIFSSVIIFNKMILNKS